jgi:hypothetical protein
MSCSVTSPVICAFGRADLDTSFPDRGERRAGDAARLIGWVQTFPWDVLSECTLSESFGCAAPARRRPHRTQSACAVCPSLGLIARNQISPVRHGATKHLVPIASTRTNCSPGRFRAGRRPGPGIPQRGRGFAPGSGALRKPSPDLSGSGARWCAPPGTPRGRAPARGEPHDQHLPAREKAFGLFLIYRSSFESLSSPRPSPPPPLRPPPPPPNHIPPPHCPPPPPPLRPRPYPKPTFPPCPPPPPGADAPAAPPGRVLGNRPGSKTASSDEAGLRWNQAGTFCRRQPMRPPRAPRSHASAQMPQAGRYAAKSPPSHRSTSDYEIRWSYSL